MGTILEVENLEIILNENKRLITAVDHVNFSLEKGKTLGIIGESGSGKSLTCYSLLGLLDKAKWKISSTTILDGEDLQYKNKKEVRKICGSKIAMIMQNPMSAFNPVITIKAHFYETLNKPGMPKKSKKEMDIIAVQLLKRMYIQDPESVLNAYAFQLSGGMLQRIMIALALAVEPEILIADEPTTALDVTVQHEILHILKDLIGQTGMSMIIVSHDLSVIRSLSDDIAVMYAGNFVEKGSAQDVLKNPKHPYTQLLFRSKPEISKTRLVMMEGQPPSLGERLSGCRFRNRCPIADQSCANPDVPYLGQEKEHICSCIKVMEGGI